MLRYRFVDNITWRRVKLTVDKTTVQAAVPDHPIFNQVTQIQLQNNQLNKKCLLFAKNGQIQVSLDQAKEFINRCKQVFGFNLQLIAEEMGVNLMLSSGEEGYNVLEAVQFKDVLRIIKGGFDGTGEKLHPKIMRKIKNYAKNSKRKSSQKQILQKIVKSYKQSQKVVQQDQPEQKPILKQPKPIKKQSQKSQKSLKSQPQQSKQSSQITQQQQYQQQDDENSRKPQSRKAKRISRKEQYQKQQQLQVQPKIQAKEESSEEDVQEMEEEEEVEVPKKNWKDNRGGNRGDNWKDNRGGRQSRNKGGYSKEYQGNQGRGSVSKEKRYDQKIMLGISGDTQAGWRERNRPPRVPARTNTGNGEYQKNKFPYKQPSSKQSQKQQYAPSQRPKQTQSRQSQRSQPSQKSQPSLKSKPQPLTPSQNGLLFTFPKDGQSFNFSQIKNSFSLFINGSFWINYNNGNLQIKKGENGYVRQSKIDIIQNGFMAEGLTLSLGGSSNIEDGGDMIGKPSIQDFTGNSSQFFHVITMEVYQYKSGPKSAQNAQVVKIQPQTKQNENKQQVKNTQSASQSTKKEGEAIKKVPVQQKSPNKNSLDVPKQKKKAQSPTKKDENDEQNWQDVSQNSQDVEQPTKSEEQYANEQDQPQQKQKYTPNLQEEQDFEQEQKVRKNRRGKPVRQKISKKSEGGNKFDDKSRSKSKSRRSSRSGKSTDRFDKGKVDPQIILGINGTTQEGWRQKQRPKKGYRTNLRVEDQDQFQLPNRTKSEKQRKQKGRHQQKREQTQNTKKSAQSQKYSQSDKQSQKSHKGQKQAQKSPRSDRRQKQQTEQFSQHQGKKVIESNTTTMPQAPIIPSQPQQQSQQQQKHKTVLISKIDSNPPIFTYHKDGQHFNFQKVKQGFKLYINKSFWVKYHSGKLQIKKGQDGYIRDSKIDIIQDGFLAEGLTLRLGDSSNLEDGGEIVGNPTISEFTGNQTQYFYVNSMEVYPY